MCWNVEVSIAFAVVETVTLIAMLVLPKSRVYWPIVPILVSVIVVEAAEAVIWSVGPVSKQARLSNDDTCPRANFVAMVFIILACAIQPFCMAVYAHKASQREAAAGYEYAYRPLVFYAILCGTISMLAQLYRLVKTSLKPEEALINVPFKYVLANNFTLSEYPNDLYYARTCAYEGECQPLLGRVARRYARSYARRCRCRDWD
jgi:hypothetical protein